MSFQFPITLLPFAGRGKEDGGGGGILGLPTQRAENQSRCPLGHALGDAPWCPKLQCETERSLGFFDASLTFKQGERLWARMSGVKFWWEKENGELWHLEIETAYLPNVGDFIEIRDKVFLITKRLWTSEVKIVKESPNDFTPPNGYGVKIILREQ